RRPPVGLAFYRCRAIPQYSRECLRRSHAHARVAPAGPSPEGNPGVRGRTRFYARSDAMTTKSMWAVVGVAMLAGTIGCARETPLAPGVAENSASTAASELTTGSNPVVTLMPDLTASPQVTTVSAGTRV